MTQEFNTPNPIHRPDPEVPAGDYETLPVPAGAPEAISPGAKDLLAWEQAHPQEKPAEDSTLILSRPSDLLSALKSFGLSVSTSLVAFGLAGAATIIVLVFASRVLPARDPVSFAWVERLIQAVTAPVDALEQQVEALRNQPIDLDRVVEQGQKIEPLGTPAGGEQVDSSDEQNDRISAWIRELKERTPSYNEILEWLRQRWKQLVEP